MGTSSSDQKNTVAYQAVTSLSVPNPSQQIGFGVGVRKITIDYQVVTNLSMPKPYQSEGFGITIGLYSNRPPLSVAIV